MVSIESLLEVSVNDLEGCRWLVEDKRGNSTIQLLAKVRDLPSCLPNYGHFQEVQNALSTVGRARIFAVDVTYSIFLR